MVEADLYPTAIGTQCDRDMPECTGGWRERGIREGATQMTLKLQLDGRVGDMNGGKEFQEETLETV